MPMSIEKQRDTMKEAVKLWGDQQKAVLRSLIEFNYQRVSPLLDTNQQTLKYLEQHIEDFIFIECELRAAQDMARFHGNELEIQSGEIKSTVYSIFTANWGDEKNLVVKKLSQPLPDQPNATFYEAHYHLKVTNLCHPNIIDIRYLYMNRVDEQNSEIWMIFPPLQNTLEQFLQQPTTLISIETAIKWMNDIADALITLHRNDFVHRNIILSNIILGEDEHIMIADLGDWYGDCNLSMRHNSSSTPGGMNDDMKGFGEIGLALITFVHRDETISTIIDEFSELMSKCADANQEKSVTAEFAQQKLKFIQDISCSRFS
jgi:serine/threonine protein kinase